MKCIEVKAVHWPKIMKLIRVSYIIALSDWRLRMIHRMSGYTSREKDNDQQNLSKC